jgi:hypothetical protein
MSFEDRLSNSMKQVAGSTPVAPLDFAGTLARGRHERRKTLTMVAGVAAAAVALGAIGASALTNDSPPVPRPVPPAGSTEPFTPSPTPSEARSASPESEPPETASGIDGGPNAPVKGVIDPDDQAIDVGRAWIDAIAAGDVDGAYGLMINPLTGEARLSKEEFKLFAQEASEGLGAYSVAKHPVYGFVPLGGSSGEGTRGVFTVRGTVTRQGFTELDAYGVPVAVLSSGAFVDLPLSNDVGIVPEQPNADSDGDGNVVGDSFLATGTVQSQKVVVEVLMAVDGTWKPADFGPSGPEQIGASARFKGIEPGTHVMTIAVVTRKGTLYSHSFVIHREGG